MWICIRTDFVDFGKFVVWWGVYRIISCCLLSLPFLFKNIDWEGEKKIHDKNTSHGKSDAIICKNNVVISSAKFPLAVGRYCFHFVIRHIHTVTHACTHVHTLTHHNTDTHSHKRTHTHIHKHKTGLYSLHNSKLSKYDREKNFRNCMYQTTGLSTTSFTFSVSLNGTCHPIILSTSYHQHFAKECARFSQLTLAVFSSSVLLRALSIT